MAKEIAGKTKNKDEQVYVYDNNMVRKKIEEAWNPFMPDWKVDIYQKIPRMDLAFWYGTGDEMGLKERKIRENIENMNRGEGKMMPLPVMQETDLVRIVKNRRMVKQQG